MGISRFWRVGVHQSDNLIGGFPLFWKSVAGNALGLITTAAFFEVSNVVNGISYVDTPSVTTSPVGVSTISQTKYDAVTYQGVQA